MGQKAWLSLQLVLKFLKPEKEVFVLVKLFYKKKKVSQEESTTCPRNEKAIEAITGGVPCIKLFLKNLQYSVEKPCVGASL